MDFHDFNILVQKNISKMLDGQSRLYVVNIDKDILWNTYLDSFPNGTNKMFRQRREFDCSCCRNFVKNFGNVVAIKDNKMVTIWDFKCDSIIYQPVIDALSSLIKNSDIESVLVTSESKFGTQKTFEKKENQDILTWNHFYYELPKSFVNARRGEEGEKRGHLNSVKDVFMGSLKEINLEALNTVCELISQNSLYKGEEYQHIINAFKISLLKFYQLENEKEKDLFYWFESLNIHENVAKIKNTLIGSLLVDITDGVDLDAAVTSYERKAAPTNYKRPKAIFTKAMIEDAKKTLEKEGISNSLDRRYAMLDDITVNNILFADRSIARNLNKNPLDEMSDSVGLNVKQFDRVEELPISKFVEDVLPTLKKLEVLVENKHSSNLVSLIAPKDSSAPTLFKWNNSFSWAYAGNITDSMKERVKAAGGRVDGDLRFSIQWNDNGDNANDFDAHCTGPNQHVNFRSMNGIGGCLDVDIMHPNKDQIAVENIIYDKASGMREGIYTFLVHNFAHRGGASGFSAEIEFEGNILSFECRRDIRQDEFVEVAKVEYSKKNGFKLIRSMPHNNSSKKLWGLQSLQFHPASVCMYSPNYWDLQDGIGHRHYFFMLQGCINDTEPNGFFNEFLKESLMKHKRVFEALGSKMKVEPSDNQLSGLGFSSTKRDSITIKITGNVSRVLKLVF